MGNWTVETDPKTVAESTARPQSFGGVKSEKDIIVYQSLHDELMQLIDDKPELQETFVMVIKILTEKFPAHKSTRIDYRIWSATNPFIYLCPGYGSIEIWIKKRRAYLNDSKRLFDTRWDAGEEYYYAEFRSQREAESVSKYVLDNLKLK